MLVRKPQPECHKSRKAQWYYCYPVADIKLCADHDVNSVCWRFMLMLHGQFYAALDYAYYVGRCLWCHPQCNNKNNMQNMNFILLNLLSLCMDNGQQLKGEGRAAYPPTPAHLHWTKLYIYYTFTNQTNVM